MSFLGLKRNPGVHTVYVLFEIDLMTTTLLKHQIVFTDPVVFFQKQLQLCKVFVFYEVANCMLLDKYMLFCISLRTVVCI